MADELTREESIKLACDKRAAALKTEVNSLRGKLDRAAIGNERLQADIDALKLKLSNAVRRQPVAVTKPLRPAPTTPPRETAQAQPPSPKKDRE